MNWATILTREGIRYYWERCAERDPGFASRARSWWESRTLPQLHGELAGSWDSNQMDSYILARSYIALAKEAERNERLWESWGAA